MQGKLVLIVGVPGAGKSTLLQYAREQFPEIVFPRSWTTRPIREGEVEGVSYHFATNEEFEQALRDNRFLEWVMIDGGHCYGTDKQAITDALAAGKFVLKDVEPIGARNIKTLLPERSVVTIFITAGSWEDVKRRILDRSPMSEEELAKREERYNRELSFEQEADFIVPNAYGELDAAKKEFARVLASVMQSE